MIFKMDLYQSFRAMQTIMRGFKTAHDLIMKIKIRNEREDFEFDPYELANYYPTLKGYFDLLPEFVRKDIGVRQVYWGLEFH
jgi:hypothetical protein